MDRGVWQATVRGAAKSWTWLDTHTRKTWSLEDRSQVWLGATALRKGAWKWTVKGKWGQEKAQDRLTKTVWLPTPAAPEGGIHLDFLVKPMDFSGFVC